MKLAKPWSKWSHHRGGRHRKERAKAMEAVKILKVQP